MPQDNEPENSIQAQSRTLNGQILNEPGKVGATQDWLKLPHLYREALPHHFSDDLVIPDNRYRGLFIYGPDAGAGKTYLACALANLWGFYHDIPGHRFGWDRSPVKFVLCPELMMRIRSSFSRENPETEADIAEECTSVALLILDDLGAESDSSFNSSTIHAIISRRIIDQRPTIITSNLSPADWRKTDGRLASRLKGMPGLMLKGKDRRIA